MLTQTNGTSTQGGYTVPFFIDGEKVIPDKTFDVVSPATGIAVHKCGSATEKDALAAVDSAAKAFKSWKKTTLIQRRDIFLKAAAIMESRKEELARIMSEETGAAAGWSEFILGLGIGCIKDVGGRLVTVEGSVPATNDPNISALVLKEPYGVVLAIAPWNAPFILGARSIAFPIAAGNTAILKASEFSPRTLVEMVSCFHEAGLPKGVLNVIVHEPVNAAAITTSLIAHPEVKKINFTGSTVVGRIIAKQAGEYLKPVLLELGGKAPAIVWEDADLDLAADQCAIGSFLHGGQICMSTERIIVHKKVSEQFQAKLSASIEKIFPTTSDAPVLINTVAVEKNKKLIKDAVGKGASVIAGNVDAKETSKTRLRPIVIKNVSTDMDIYKTESFGPSVSFFEVETEEEALAIANDTEYGLTSAVFTEDLRTGLRFAKEIESGAVHINNMTVHDESGLPHGGVKSSGFGRFNSTGLEEWVRTKTITFRN
ncbi:Aldehyde dehydrogenase [Colletotrichum higginsianum IMI 349063]|uniref:Aldehyde dehydrogenase n=1 Tax=Colletotrichum higginsianum (strain IMI 349063) TaxID=759273 RepID=A0A1B7YDK0_COLHI|nr:Aldehyde dehydrogenase [Colletotrichum higginsianum IMI 349063]OBR10125.1 Aldehyde dehydrogenase [Colletotrichum higginsianum IMI 349063]